MFRRTLSSLFLDACLLFLVDEAEWMILETGGGASDVAREEIQLVLAGGAKSEHPGLRLRDAITMYRVVSLSTLIIGRDQDRWGRDAVDGGHAMTSRVLSNCEDIGGTVVQPITFFEGVGDGIETTVACESNLARTAVLVSFLVPVDKGITGLENGVGRNDCFSSILTIVARLVVD